MAKLGGTRPAGRTARSQFYRAALEVRSPLQAELGIEFRHFLSALTLVQTFPYDSSSALRRPRVAQRRRPSDSDISGSECGAGRSEWAEQSAAPITAAIIVQTSAASARSSQAARSSHRRIGFQFEFAPVDLEAARSRGP